jgi:hypothetical protein
MLRLVTREIADRLPIFGRKSGESGAPAPDRPRPGIREPRLPTPAESGIGVPGPLCSDRNQESGIRNSRRDATQEWAMPAQVQELQVPGTPEGGTLARVPPSTLRTGRAAGTAPAVVTVGKKIVARTGMGPRNDPFLAPTTHATCGKSSAGSSRMGR